MQKQEVKRYLPLEVSLDLEYKMKCRAKANRVLPRECTGHGKQPHPTTPETKLHRDLTRWSIPKSD